MKFITEGNLRDIYKKEPFTSYEIEPGTRLTPGGRQYLLDLGVKIQDQHSVSKKSIRGEQQQASPPKTQNNWKMKKLHAQIKSVQASFLQVGQELLSRDVILAQRVTELGRNLTPLYKGQENGETIKPLCHKPCTGIKIEDFSKELDDCFELTQFHVQLEKGREIILLHGLRCSLREVEVAILETYDGQEKMAESMVGRVNEIINTLSQLICLTFGGEKCLRNA